jgi:hypothetical protein
MAKKDKKADKPAKEEAKAEKAAEREFKFGVEDIAEKLDIKPASVRVQLRNKGIEKAGKSYGWNSKADLDAVIAQLKADKSEDKPAKGKKGAKDEPAAEGKKSKKDKKKNK